MQCDFPFHFPSSGNGLARLAIASPVSLALPIFRPLLLSPLSEMGLPGAHVSPTFATLAATGTGEISQKKKELPVGIEPTIF